MRQSESLLYLVWNRFTALGAICLFVVAAVLPKSVVADELQAPGQIERQVALRIAAMMEQRHLLRRELDNEISRRAFDGFLKSLDPQKVYFYQSDIDAFNREADNLDDMIKRGDLSFPIKVFNTFIHRVDERVATIDQLLEGDFDFTIDEDMVTDRDLLAYPSNQAEALDRWRKRIKFNLLVLKSDKTEKDDPREKLRKRYHSFAKRMQQYDTEEVVEMFLNSITTSFDPHTAYFSKSSFDSFMIQMNLNLEGIGASLAAEDGITTVKRIVPGGAAAKHGKLKVEDRIVSVGQGNAGEMVDVTDMKLDDVVQLIRGKARTIVRLGVMPAGSNEVKELVITRERIELEDEAAHGEIFESGAKPNGEAFKIGVIDLPSFYRDMDAAIRGVGEFRSTTRDMRKILDDFTAKGVDAVVLDLRQNGGGSLTEAIECTGLFIKDGVVVQAKDNRGVIMPYRDPESGIAWSGPLVVMTSKFSASASEILAGAIKDYRRGLVVGDSATHGKGTVQSLKDLDQEFFGANLPQRIMGALKITQQQFYRPNGESTQKKGVLADVVLPSFSDHMDVGEGDLDYAVDFDRVNKARYTDFSMVDDNIVRKLSTDSAARRGGSEFFQDLEENIEKYLVQKSKKTVTLNEEKFFAEQDLDSEKREEEALEEQINGTGEVKIDRNEYLDEVLTITADYVEMLREKNLAIK